MADFTTYDLGQAAYLVAKRHPLRRIDGPGRKLFVFDETAAVDASKYFANELVGAMDLVAAMRQVKGLLYSRAI